MSLLRVFHSPSPRVLSRALSRLACLLALLGSLAPGGTIAAARAQSLPLPLQQTLTGGYPFGDAVAMDGAFLAVGEQPRVRTFIRAGGVWSSTGTVGDGTVPGFGIAVALSGTTLVVGAPGAVSPGSVASGAAFVYDWTGSAWALTTTLYPSDGANSGAFGSAVATDGRFVAIGAPSAVHSQGGQANGKAYVFDRSVNWLEERLPLDPRHRRFGQSVSLSNGTLCVGSPLEVQNGLDRGAAHVFERSGNTWTSTGRLLAPDAAAIDEFGRACAVSGDRLAVGAPGVDENAPEQGAVYTFTRVGTAWSFESQVFATVPIQGDRFGSLVALSGSTLVATTNPLNTPGGVTLFTRSGVDWANQQQIDDVALAEENSVAFDGTSLAIGVPGITGPGSYVRVFASGPQVPGAPQSFAAAGAGNAVEFSWAAPAQGGVPTEYRLRARVGGQIVYEGSVGTARTFRTVAPSGTFAVTAYAVNAVGAGAESNTVTVTLPMTATPPAAPTGLTAAVAGSTATLTWTPPAGSFVETYVVLAGATPGFTTPIASLTTAASPLVVPVVPAGTYYVRVVAQNAAGFSAASNEVTLTVAPPSPPAAPVLNAPVKSGTAVTLSWAPGAGGGVPASYELRVAAVAGGPAILAPVTLSGTTQTFGPVPAGTYYLRLRATNTAGTSAYSNEVVLTVP